MHVETPPARGFALPEAIVAIALVAVAVAGLSGWLVVAARANRVAGLTTNATVLAVQKMEQLRALAWGSDAAGLPRSDLTSDIAAIRSVACPTGGAAGAGVGLSPSPPGTLSHTVPGYADYVDAVGCGLGYATSPPAGAVFLRRWAIVMLPFPPDTLALRVIACPVEGGPSLEGDLSRRSGAVSLASVKTRRTW